MGVLSNYSHSMGSDFTALVCELGCGKSEKANTKISRSLVGDRPSSIFISKRYNHRVFIYIISTGRNLCGLFI
jgi:hypothetical protein